MNKEADFEAKCPYCKSDLDRWGPDDGYFKYECGTWGWRKSGIESRMDDCYKNEIAILKEEDEQLRYYYLDKGEIIQEGDEAEVSNGWNADPKWIPSTGIGEPASDPQYPAHAIIRRSKDNAIKFLKAEVVKLQAAVGAQELDRRIKDGILGQ